MSNHGGLVETEPYAMREPCKCAGRGTPCACGDSTAGYLQTRNGQDCVFCASCNHLQYCAPRSETGREVRKVSTSKEGISPKIRARVLAINGGRCRMCNRRGVLHVDHIIPVKVCTEQGLPDEVIHSEWNLRALCEECNLGKRDLVLPQDVIALVLAALHHIAVARLK